MSVQKKIRYHAIFKTDDQKDHIQYDVKADYHKGKKTVLSFQAEGHQIKISYDAYQIDLQNDQSHLHLDIRKDVLNHYQIAYGMIIVRIRTLLFEGTDDHIQLKYEIYEQDELLTTVYLFITMKDC